MPTVFNAKYTWFTGEEWEKARKLQDKMKSNLENTRERLDELGRLTQ